MDCCSWLKPILFHAERRKVINKAVKALRKIDFEIVAVTGYSSTIVGSIVAQRLGKEITIVRKSGEPRASQHSVEGRRDGRYVFIDDLIDCGDTLKRVRYSMIDCQLVGVYLYHSSPTNSYEKGKYHGVRILSEVEEVPCPE